MNFFHIFSFRNESVRKIIKLSKNNFLPKSSNKSLHIDEPKSYSKSNIRKTYEQIILMVRHFESKFDAAGSLNVKSQRLKENYKLNNTPLNRVSRESLMPPQASIKKRTAMDDHVSKNISMLLEDLLKSYENSQIPTHGQGK